MQLVIRNHRDTGEREMVARCDANWDLGDSSTPAASTIPKHLIYITLVMA
jgi:hypothetical protein